MVNLWLICIKIAAGFVLSDAIPPDLDKCWVVYALLMSPLQIYPYVFSNLKLISKLLGFVEIQQDAATRW